jgi:hypothetical protein
MRTALRYLASQLGRGEDRDTIVELSVVVVLIVVIVAFALVFLGDPIANLITVIGGRVDEGLVGD